MKHSVRIQPRHAADEVVALLAHHDLDHGGAFQAEGIGEYRRETVGIIHADAPCAQGSGEVCEPRRLHIGIDHAPVKGFGLRAANGREAAVVGNHRHGFNAVFGCGGEFVGSHLKTAIAAKRHDLLARAREFGANGSGHGKAQCDRVARGEKGAGEGNGVLVKGAVSNGRDIEDDDRVFGKGVARDAHDGHGRAVERGFGACVCDEIAPICRIISHGFDQLGEWIARGRPTRRLQWDIRARVLAGPGRVEFCDLAGEVSNCACQFA